MSITKSIIVAYNRKKAIGKDNDLLFKDREDLKRFKELTSGHPIIMGRKTHESIGRLLPDRTNIIVSRDRNYVPLGFPSYLVESLGAAVMIAETVADDAGLDEVFIIGGGEIYKQALPLCNAIYVSEFDNDLDGDTFFPEYDKSQWTEVIVEQCETHTFKLPERISEEKDHQRKGENTKESQAALQ